MYELIAHMVFGQPWALEPEKLAAIVEALEYRMSGGRWTEAETRARLTAAGVVGEPEAPQAYKIEAAAGQGGARTGGTVMVLPLRGTIAHRAGLLVESSGGTSTERFTGQFRQALADPEVGSILLDIDSPGGSVRGVPELAKEIYGSRGAKPVLALANSLAASGAYWIGSAADELWVIPSGEVGSIGVYMAHRDLSAAYEREGVRTTLVSAGKYKTEGHPYAPLSEEDRTAMQATVDEFYGMFVAAVAQQRGVSRDTVRGGFGEGRVVTAKNALAGGMVDGIGTFDEAVARAARLAKRPAAVGGKRTESQRLVRARLAGL